MILYDIKLNFGPFWPIFPSETLKNAPYDCKQNVPTTDDHRASANLLAYCSNLKLYLEL